MKGQCLCGNIRYIITSPVTRASACHCRECRRQSGHVWSSAQTHVDGLSLRGVVTWFEASKTAKRGFCAKCGTFLFWRAHDEESISFSLGSVDGPTGLQLEKHIFTAEKGDYYDIADEVPQF